MECDKSYAAMLEMVIVNLFGALRRCVAYRGDPVGVGGVKK
jgi:hypothetical protein